ncbi:MAG TPA: hypothetical protein VHA75_18485 [Rugosimonospora sp.]|nr:hypothetical protein [Rugosimonospora sp.]
MTLTAHAPTPALLRSLQRAGWGPLGGREWQGVRSTLGGLASLLPDRSGEGLATVPQIASTAGLGERWVRRCLGVLEDLGVITWTRGGIDETGTPVPSGFRIAKRVLLDLIAQARPIRDAAVQAARSATAARLAAARFLRRPGKRRRRSDHAALRAGSSPLTGEGASGSPPTEEGMTMPKPDVGYCEHGDPIGYTVADQPRCFARRVLGQHCDAYPDDERTTTTTAPRGMIPIPRVDYAALAAHDDTLWSD